MTKDEPDENHTATTFPKYWIAKLLFFNSLFLKVMHNKFQEFFYRIFGEKPLHGNIKSSFALCLGFLHRSEHER